MRAWLIVSAVSLVAFAPAPLPKRQKAGDVQSRLVGTWQIRTIKWQGRDSYQAASFGGGIVNKSDRVVITRGRISFEASGASTKREYDLRLTGKDGILSIDLTGVTEKSSLMGLVELKGGVMHFSYGINNDRPKSLTGDGNEIAFVMDRK